MKKELFILGAIIILVLLLEHVVNRLKNHIKISITKKIV